MIQNELEEGNTSLNGNIDKKIVKVKYTITNDAVAILLDHLLISFYRFAPFDYK